MFGGIAGKIGSSVFGVPQLGASSSVAFSVTPQGGDQFKSAVKEQAPSVGRIGNKMPDATEMPTEHLVRQYVGGFIKFIGDDTSDVPIKIRSYYHSGRENLSQNFELKWRCKNEVVMRDAMRTALDVSDTFTAGVAMGFLNEKVPATSLGSEKFQKGFMAGQVSRLKNHPFLSSGFYLGLVGNAILVSDLIMTPPELSEQNIQNVLNNWGTVFPFSIDAMRVCAVAVFLQTPWVFRNIKPHEGGALRRFVRHPFATAAAGLVFSSSSVAFFINQMAVEPSALKTAGLLASAGIITLLGHKRIVRDEAAMEKIYGDEYKKYKAETPMYLFNLDLLIRTIADKVKKVFRR